LFETFLKIVFTHGLIEIALSTAIIHHNRGLYQQSLFQSRQHKLL